MNALVRVLPGTPALVVDAGGPGQPVVDAMRAAGLKSIAVSITAGKRSRRAVGMVYVPKRELVRQLVTAFENGRLKVAKGLPLGLPAASAEHLECSFGPPSGLEATLSPTILRRMSDVTAPTGTTKWSRARVRMPRRSRRSSTS